MILNIKHFSNFPVLHFFGPLNPPQQWNDAAPWETNCISACHYHINSASAVNKGPQYTHTVTHTHTQTHTRIQTHLPFFFSLTNLQTKLQILACKILSLWICRRKKEYIPGEECRGTMQTKTEMNRQVVANSCWELFDRCRDSQRMWLVHVQISAQWLQAYFYVIACVQFYFFKPWCLYCTHTVRAH